MKTKQQRTVYRMTLVKSWNMDEVEEYADLIEVNMSQIHYKCGMNEQMCHKCTTITCSILHTGI